VTILLIIATWILLLALLVALCATARHGDLALGPSSEDAHRMSISEAGVAAQHVPTSADRAGMGCAPVGGAPAADPTEDSQGVNRIDRLPVAVRAG